MKYTINVFHTFFSLLTSSPMNLLLKNFKFVFNVNQLHSVAENDVLLLSKIITMRTYLVIWYVAPVKLWRHKQVLQYLSNYSMKLNFNFTFVINLWPFYNGNKNHLILRYLSSVYSSAACLLLCENSITGNWISYQCSMITKRTRGATWSVVVMGERCELTGTWVNYNFPASNFLSGLPSTQPFLTALYSQPIALVVIIHDAITLLPPPCHQSSYNGSFSECLFVGLSRK